MDKLATTRSRTEMLLGQVFQAPISLEVLDQFESDHTLLRCAVHSPDTARSIPGTVIIKQRDFSQVRKPNGFDQTLLFCNEWAALDFLSANSGGDKIGPRVYASAYQAGLVVLEDLGALPTVQEVLYGTDRQAAVDALVEMGKMFGRLQGITLGLEEDFVDRQTAQAAATPLSDSSLDCRSRMEDLHACFLALGVAANGRFDGALHQLESAIHGPGLFRTFIHQDAGPHNFMVTTSGVQLLDFEFAGYRYGLLDVVCARLAFPPAFRGRVLPVEVVRQIEKNYRIELAERVPAVLDEPVFSEAVAQACAHWAYSKLLGFWCGYLKERLLEGEACDSRDGRSPERSAFFRRQVFTYLRLALATLEEQDKLAELRTALSQIVARLLELWPDTPLLPGYPAFGGEPWHYP